MFYVISHNLYVNLHIHCKFLLQCATVFRKKNVKSLRTKSVKIPIGENDISSSNIMQGRRQDAKASRPYDSFHNDIFEFDIRLLTIRDS